MDTSKYLGWHVMECAPRCEKIVAHRNHAYSTSACCNTKLVMDKDWKPSPNMDTWLTKWICPKCGTEEYINRAVLPLDCGGRR
jgi:hypothetical protein